MNIRLLSHKSIASLFYTFYWDTNAFPAAFCLPSPHFLNKLQRQKRPVPWKFKRKSSKSPPPHYRPCCGWPGKERTVSRPLWGLQKRKWTSRANHIDKVIINVKKRRRGIGISISKVLQTDEGSVTAELVVTERQNSREPQLQLKPTFQGHTASCLRPISWWPWWWVRDPRSSPIYQSLTPPRFWSRPQWML